MSLFQTWAELRQESRYTRSKASGFNVSSAYVLKSDMDLYSPVDAVSLAMVPLQHPLSRKFSRTPWWLAGNTSLTIFAHEKPVQYPYPEPPENGAARWGRVQERYQFHFHCHSIVKQEFH